MPAAPSRTFRGQTADERRAGRRAALVEAALDLVARDGWGPTTMTAICRTAGLTERYFYESFENRDALFVALIEDTVRRIEQAVTAAATRADATPEARVRLVVDAVLEALLRDPRIGRVALLEGAEHPAVHRVRRRALDRFELLLQEHAVALLGAPPEPASSTALTAASLVGATLELLTRRLNGTLPGTEADLAEHLIRLGAVLSRG